MEGKFSIWDNEIEKKEKQKKWTDNFRKIGEEVYTFFVDTVIEKGYENREGQWDMSCEITDAMKRKQHILVEAGVGIGKTFAYIVPLLSQKIWKTNSNCYFNYSVTGTVGIGY